MDVNIFREAVRWGGESIAGPLSWSARFKSQLCHLRLRVFQNATELL